MVSRNILTDRGHLGRVQMGPFPFAADNIQFLILIKRPSTTVSKKSLQGLIDIWLLRVMVLRAASCFKAFAAYVIYICCNVEQTFYFTFWVFLCETNVSSACAPVLYSAPNMDQISKKTPNPKCRLYLCLIEFIDCVSHAGIFDPFMWTSAPLTFSLVHLPPPSPPTMCE